MAAVDGGCEPVLGRHVRGASAMTSKDWQTRVEGQLCSGSLRDRAAAHHTSTATRLVLRALILSTNVLRVSLSFSDWVENHIASTINDAICLTSKDQSSNDAMNA